MFIEFACDDCQTHLRIPAKREGWAVRCPNCQAVLRAPVQDVDSLAGLSARPRQPVSTALSASSDRVEASTHTPDRAVWQPTRADLGQILRESWAIYIANLGLLLVNGLVELALIVLACLAVLAPAVLVLIVAQRSPLALLGAFIVLVLGATYFGAVVMAGQYAFLLKLARGQRPRAMEAFTTRGLASQMASHNVLFFGLVGLGLLCAVVPGLFVATFYWPYGRVLVDKRPAGTRAFAMARELARLNLGNSLALGLICLVLQIIGAGLWLVGVLFAVPLMGVILTVAYLRMSGQHVHVPNIHTPLFSKSKRLPQPLTQARNE